MSRSIAKLVLRSFRLTVPRFTSSLLFRRVALLLQAEPALFYSLATLLLLYRRSNKYLQLVTESSFFTVNFSSFFLGLFSLFGPSFLLYCRYLPPYTYSGIRTVFHTIFNIYWLYICSNHVNSELPTLLSFSITALAVKS